MSQGGCFEGKTVSFSLKGGGGEGSGAELRSLVGQCGGRISGMVHKKVAALVASAGSVRQRSKAVRHAVRRGVPVVTGEWVRRSVAEGRPLDCADFLHDTGGVAAEEGARSSRKAAEADGGGGPVVAEWEGCYCVCHDHEQPYCSWCHKSHPDEAPWPRLAEGWEWEGWQAPKAKRRRRR